jgi:chaperonin cofactor prefoldin
MENIAEPQTLPERLNIQLTSLQEQRKRVDRRIELVQQAIQLLSDNPNFEPSAAQVLSALRY